jgi:hypothetical protein
MFDLKIRKGESYNTIKRRFYYQLGNSGLSSSSWKTKSVLYVSETLEKEADAFFRGWGANSTVFKAKVKWLKKLN